MNKLLGGHSMAWQVSFRKDSMPQRNTQKWRVAPTLPGRRGPAGARGRGSGLGFRVEGKGKGVQFMLIDHLLACGQNATKYCYGMKPPASTK